MARYKIVGDESLDTIKTIVDRIATDYGMTSLDSFSIPRDYRWKYFIQYSKGEGNDAIWIYLTTSDEPQEIGFDTTPDLDVKAKYEIMLSPTGGSSGSDLQYKTQAQQLDELCALFAQQLPAAQIYQNHGRGASAWRLKTQC